MSFQTSTTSFLLLLLLTVSSVSAQSPGDRVPGAFIVQLSGSCTGRCRGALQSALASSSETSGCTLGPRGIPIGDLEFDTIQCPPGGSTEAEALSAAFAASSEVQAGPAVQEVGADVFLTTTATSTSLWGVDEADGGVFRDSTGNPVRDGLRTCSMSSNNGLGVTVWILDTGCVPTNGDTSLCTGFFGGSGLNACSDGNGHGTHVAGIATDATFGVAPAATRACVKVLSDSGSGSLSSVLNGISFAEQNSGNTPNGDVINMSLGASLIPLLNAAVEEVAANGIYFTLAAGNSAINACNASPASASGSTVFTVAAHDIGLNSAFFTNFGTSAANCVDLSAPGVNIESNRVGGGSRFLSGTSMAAPHVAGGCARLLSDGLVPTVALLTSGGVPISRSGALDQPCLGVTCT